MTSQTSPGHGRVLIADDQPDILDALKLLLEPDGFEVATAASPAELVGALEREDFDVALIDLNYTRDTTSGQEGFELQAGDEIQVQRSQTPLRLIKPTTRSYFEVLRTKLKWGER